MKIVLDSNIIISALLHDSAKRALLELADFEFYFPLEGKKEIEKYKPLILKKSGLSKKEYRLLFNKIFENLEVVKQRDLKPFMPEAKSIMDSIDPKDTLFIACALALPGSMIWTDDAHFRRQHKIRIVSQRELIGMLSG